MKTLLENPLMIFIISAIRHAITGGLLLLIALLKLPDELRAQVESAADWSAPVIAAFLAWFVLKYGAIALKKIGYLNMIAIGVLGAGAISMSACSAVDVTVDTRGALPTEPDSDGDGIPDEVTVSSRNVKPVLSNEGRDRLNREVAKIIIRATK